VIALPVVIGLYIYTHICLHIYICIYKNATLSVCLLELLMVKINMKTCKNVSTCGQSISNNLLRLRRLENATLFF